MLHKYFWTEKRKHRKITPWCKYDTIKEIIRFSSPESEAQLIFSDQILVVIYR